MMRGIALCFVSFRASSRLRRETGISVLAPAAFAFAFALHPAHAYPAVEQAFADFDTPPAPYRMAPHAVDLDSFLPPRQIQLTPTRSLGMGEASYYAHRFHGRRTASGERFNMNAMTAAHKTLPFGTKVRVTNPANRRSVVVRINDRGPFTNGRVIDVSHKAAQRLGIITAGHARVKLEIVQ